MKKQSGVTALLFLVGLITLAILIIAGRTSSAPQAALDRTLNVSTRFEAIQRALVAFVAANGRLPCPALGTANTGVAAPDVAPYACTALTGTVPWSTLGLAVNDAIDEWGNKISYRVFAGATGLTQTGGASMADCDTVQSFPRAVTAAGLCRTQKDTSPANFLASKGLNVVDGGTAVAGVAYVLISHGPSGRGAFTSSGVQTTLPAAGGDELTNTMAAGPFVKKVASVAGTDPGVLMHFDDLMVYQSITDLINQAGTNARDWPDAPVTVASVTLNTATVSAALETPATVGTNLGVNTLYLGNATLTGFNSSGDTTLSLNNSNSTDGVGVGGTDVISAGSAEGVRISFALNARKFAMTLNRFGSGTVSGIPYQERAELRFFNGATQVGPAVIVYSCRPSNPLASFSVDAGADFSAVELRPLTATPNVGFSSFYLSAFETCLAGAATCTTSLANAGNNCP